MWCLWDHPVVASPPCSRSVAGLEPITSGDISIGGRNVSDLAPAQREIAMVFQSYALYPHMNVENNMAFGLRFAGTPKDEIQKRVTEAARILQLEPLLKRRPRELSGGAAPARGHWPGHRAQTQSLPV